MDNAHVVEVFHSIQDLLDEFAGVLLSVEALLYNAVEQLPARNPASETSQLVTDSIETLDRGPHQCFDVSIACRYC